MNKHVRLPSFVEEAQLGVRKAVTGLRHEQAVFDALRGMRPGSPGWYYGFRPATLEEDRAGVDLIAEIDIGDVPIQIKSSVCGMQHHHQRYSGKRIACLIVTDHLSRAQIQHQFFVRLEEFRARFFKEARR